MDSLTNLLTFNGHFLGIEWHFWAAIGWLGNAIFSTRFFVQWYATERRKQVTIPTAFWWLSLLGSLSLFAYALHRRDPVFIVANGVSWIPYVRNLIIHYRHQGAQQTCGQCGTVGSPSANYCPHCGCALNANQPADGTNARR